MWAGELGGSERWRWVLSSWFGFSRLLCRACGPRALGVGDYGADGGVITLGTEPERLGAVEAIGQLFAGLPANHWQQQQGLSLQE